VHSGAQSRITRESRVNVTHVTATGRSATSRLLGTGWPGGIWGLPPGPAPGPPGVARPGSLGGGDGEPGVCRGS